MRARLAQRSRPRRRRVPARRHLTCLEPKLLSEPRRLTRGRCLLRLRGRRASVGREEHRPSSARLALFEGGSSAVLTLYPDPPSFHPLHTHTRHDITDMTKADAPGRGNAPLLTLVLILALALRLHLLSIPGLQSQLQDRIELNDPFTSWNAVTKALWVSEEPLGARAQSVWGGSSEVAARAQSLSYGRLDSGEEDVTDTSRAVPPPLLLLLLEPFVRADEATRGHHAPRVHTSSGDLSCLLFVALDIASILLLYRIAALRLRSPVSIERPGPAKLTNRLKARHLLQSLSVLSLRHARLPLAIAAIYAFNPFIFLPALARSGTTLVNTSLLVGVWGAMEGHAPTMALGMSLASAQALHPLLLFPPTTMLCARQRRYWRLHRGVRHVGKRRPDSVWDWLAPAAWFVVLTATMMGASAMFLTGQTVTLPSFLAAMITTPTTVTRNWTEWDWRRLWSVYRGL